MGGNERESPSALPTGTVTFLFTDVVGSTQAWDADHERMAAAAAHHDQVLRRLWDEAGGTVFTTAGDSFAVAFSDPGAAVAAAEAAQRALAVTEWPNDLALRIRIGVHTGVADERDGDYFGRDVSLAARIEAAAHAGQILLSEATASLVPAVDLTDFGLHRMRGISEPQRLFGVAATIDGDRPPNALPVDLTNLPVTLDRFVEARDELARLVEVVGDARLVTVVGPGGAGKTRWAVEAAHAVASRFADGVWFADLAAVDEDGVVAAVAEALPLTLGAGGDPGRQIVGRLRDEQMLLVLDNCEHVVDGVADLVEDLLAGTAAVHVLATSRQRLEVAGETVLVRDPLAVESDDGSDSPALELLRERARGVLGGVDVVEQAPGPCRRICELVDGLPLGIELAAARLRALSPDDLARDLQQRLDVLSSRRRRRAGRHRTLRDVVAWSYELLDEHEKQAFVELSVFAGSFTVDAATAVCPALATGASAVVADLVDKSLLVPDDGPTGRRFRMLVTLREFGRERLVGDGRLDDVRDRHLRWTLGRVAVVEEALYSAELADALDSVRDESDDFRAAREHARAMGELQAELRITSVVPLELPAERSILIRRLLRAAAESGVELDPFVRAHAGKTGGEAAFVVARYPEAVVLTSDACAASTGLADPSVELFARRIRAMARWGARPDDDLLADMEALVSDTRRRGDPLQVANAEYVLALWLHHRHPEDPRLLEMAERVARVPRTGGDYFATAHGEELLASVLADRGRVDEAAAEIRSALATFHRRLNASCASHCMTTAAVIAMRSGRISEAAELVGAADAVHRASFTTQRPWEEEARRSCESELRSVLGDAAFEASAARGDRLGVDDAVAQVFELLS